MDTNNTQKNPLEHARECGAIAADNGIRRNSNPFQTPLFRDAWFSGYDAARKCDEVRVKLSAGNVVVLAVAISLVMIMIESGIGFLAKLLSGGGQ
jgi:ribosome modulation factor